MESLMINVLNCFNTIAEKQKYKLLLYEILEYIGQLNQELFIAVSGIINPLALIYDIESSIGNILTSKVHQLD